MADVVNAKTTPMRNMMVRRRTSFSIMHVPLRYTVDVFMARLAELAMILPFIPRSAFKMRLVAQFRVDCHQGRCSSGHASEKISKARA
jgi:hypothetical protein